jgi:hypothetical protein
MSPPEQPAGSGRKDERPSRGGERAAPDSDPPDRTDEPSPGRGHPPRSTEEPSAARERPSPRMDESSAARERRSPEMAESSPRTDEPSARPDEPSHRPERPSAAQDEQPGRTPGAETAASPDDAEARPAARDSGDPSISTLATEWLAAVGERVRGHADLLLAETKLALGTFVLMIFVAVLAAGAVLFAWGFLALAIAQIPLSMGVSPLVTALIMLALHLLLALILWRIASSLGRNMEFRATRRLLQPPPKDNDETEDS